MDMQDYQKQCEAQVIELGERIGYGNMMTIASTVWGNKLRRSGMGAGGQFTVGPCEAVMVRCDCKIPSRCNWCCGTRLLTKHVKAMKFRLDADGERRK